MNYRDMVDLIVEGILNESPMHSEDSVRYPGYPTDERRYFGGNLHMHPSIAGAAEAVGQRIAGAHERGGTGPLTFLYRPKDALNRGGQFVHDVQGTANRGTAPPHLNQRLTPGLEDITNFGVDFAGQVFYPSPHLAVHASKGRSDIMVAHAGLQHVPLMLGRREEPEVSTQLSHDLAMAALGAMRNPRDTTVDKRHSILHHLKFEETPYGVAFTGDPKELHNYGKDYADIHDIHDQFRKAAAGKHLADSLRRRGIGSIIVFPQEHQGLSSKIIFTHQDNLRTKRGVFEPSFINRDVDWEGLQHRVAHGL